ncbi:MAG TPA: hypothetical protein VEZ14_10985 [Dehalococcoidia bacterium]|nr:hypothetical protein [Dehalococcoidia bacterium]
MRKTFLRTLAVTAVMQFIVTRTRAGHAIEEGSAERMWMLYPVNVLANALAWTLLIAAAARVTRALRTN